MKKNRIKIWEEDCANYVRLGTFLDSTLRRKPYVSALLFNQTAYVVNDFLGHDLGTAFLAKYNITWFNLTLRDIIFGRESRLDRSHHDL